MSRAKSAKGSKEENLLVGTAGPAVRGRPGGASLPYFAVIVALSTINWKQRRDGVMGNTPSSVFSAARKVDNVQLKSAKLQPNFIGICFGSTRFRFKSISRGVG